MSALLLLLTTGLAAVGGVEVRVSADVPCVDARRLEQTLKARLGEALGQVSVEPEGAALTIILQRPGAPAMVRRLTVRPDDCGDLEQTIALIAGTWWNSAQKPAAPRHGASAPAPPPPLRPDARSAPAPTAVPTGPRSGETPPMLRTGTEPEAPAPAPEPTAPGDTAHLPAASELADQMDAGAPTVAAPEAPDPAAAVVARIGAAPSGAEPVAAPLPPVKPPDAPAAKTAVPALAATPAASKWLAAVSLRGQGTYDGDVPVGGGALALDAGLRQGVGGGLDLGVESSRGAALKGGSISAWLSHVSLLARFRLAFARAGLLLGLGMRLFIVSASASGFTSSTSAVLLSPAAVATAELQWRLTGGFFVSASLQGFLRFQRELLVIHGVSGNEPINPLGGTLGLGAGWTL